jgi:hypothetical protein
MVEGKSKVRDSESNYRPKRQVKKTAKLIPLLTIPYHSRAHSPLLHTFRVIMAGKIKCLCPCGKKVDQKTLRRHVGGHARPKICALQIHGLISTGSARTPLQSLRKRQRRLATSPSTPRLATSPGMPLHVKKPRSKLLFGKHTRLRAPQSPPDVLHLNPLPPSPIITNNDRPPSPSPQDRFEGSIGHPFSANEAELSTDDTSVIPPSFSTPVPPRGHCAIVLDSDSEGEDFGSSKGDNSASSDDEIALDALLVQDYVVGDWEDINEDLMDQLESLGMWHQLFFHYEETECPQVVNNWRSLTSGACASSLTKSRST